MRSPEHAPPRPDLGWLRHRRVEHHHIEYVHPPRAHAAPAPAPAPGAPSLDLTLRPAAPAAPAAHSSTTPRQRPRTLPYRRLPSGTTVVLKGRERSVTLTRLQSGVGTLQHTLTAAPQVGQLGLGLGLVVATVDGATHVVQRRGGAASTPGPLPCVRLVGGPGGAEQLLVDLRQVGTLVRVLLYVYSPTDSATAWDGVLTVATHDGSRVEVPFDLPASVGTLALATLYAVHGELVLRAELDVVPGPPEAAAEAYGFHAAWLDGRTPVR